MGQCLGCGVILQTKEAAKQGYCLTLNHDYCQRCFKIKHYHELIAGEINPELFWPQLEKIISQPQPQEFYYVLDLFDLDFCRNQALEQLLAQQRVVVVLNKVDLLPKAVKLTKIHQYLTQIFAQSPLQNCEILLVSKFQPQLMQELLSRVEQNSDPKYFIGYSNVGKSSLINALLAAKNLTPKILTSNYFHTTLAPISVQIKDNSRIIDTPGIAQFNSWSLLTPLDQRKYFYFTRELKQVTFQLTTNQSLILGGLLVVTFQFVEPQKLNLHFYGNPLLDWHRTKQTNVAKFFQKHQNQLYPHPAVMTNNWKETDFLFQQESRKSLDLVLAGLGWINFQPTKSLRISVSTNGEMTDPDLKKLLKIREALI